MFPAGPVTSMFHLRHRLEWPNIGTEIMCSRYLNAQMVTCAESGHGSRKRARKDEKQLAGTKTAQTDVFAVTLRSRSLPFWNSLAYETTLKIALAFHLPLY